MFLNVTSLRTSHVINKLYTSWYVIQYMILTDRMLGIKASGGHDSVQCGCACTCTCTSVWCLDGADVGSLVHTLYCRGGGRGSPIENRSIVL